MKSAAGLVLSLLLAFAMGCQTAPSRRPYAPFQVGKDVPLDAPEVALRLEALEANTRSRLSLVAAAKVSLEGPDVSLNRPQRIAVMRPASMRVEILGLFGQVAAILVTDGSVYQLWDASNARTIGGVVTRDLLWSVAQVDLSPDEAARLLLGDPTSGVDVRVVAAVSLPDGVLVVSLGEHDGDGTRTVEFDAAGRVTRALRYDAAGTLLWDASFGDYRDAGEEALAHDVTIEFPGFDARASFQLERAELNRALSAAVFTLPKR